MFLKYITLFSGFNFLLFSIALFSKKSPSRKDNLLLGALFFVMGIYSTLLFFSDFTLYYDSEVFLNYYFPLDYGLIMLMGPLLYLYVKSLLNQKVDYFSWKQLIHLPPIIASFSFIVYFMSLGMEGRIGILKANLHDTVWQIAALNGIFYIQMTSYLLCTLRLVTNFLKDSKRVAKGSFQVDVSWLKPFLILDLVITLLTAPACFYFKNENASNIIAQLAMDVQLLYIFIKLMMQSDVFPARFIREVKAPDPVLKVNDHVAVDHLNAIQLFMNAEKPYLNEKCSMMYVSEKTGIPAHYISHVINQKFNKSFPDYINEYRVNAAREILGSGKCVNMTLEAIGYECGFGSKSSFNKAFKKQLDITPSQYRSEVQKNTKIDE